MKDRHIKRRLAIANLVFCLIFLGICKVLAQQPRPIRSGVGDQSTGDNQATRVTQSTDRYQSRVGHPAGHLPPYIKQVSGFGERPEWSHDGQRILFVDKPMGEVYELDLVTGLIDPKTRHFNHYGFTRANYLANGDLLLSGSAVSFDVANRDARDMARHHCWLSVLPAAGDATPIPLGTMAAEGPAVSRTKMKIAWTHRDKQDPTLGKNHARHFVADIVDEGGNPIALVDVDLKNVSLRLTHDGKELHTARGSDCWEGPWETGLWLANFAHRQGIRLQPGQVILCGALGKVQPAKTGRYEMSAGPLGKITFSVGE